MMSKKLKFYVQNMTTGRVAQRVYAPTYQIAETELREAGWDMDDQYMLVHESAIDLRETPRFNPEWAEEIEER